MGVPISWKSQAQRSMTLLSNEAKCVALSEATKEIKFIIQVLLSIGIEVEMPVIIQFDNIGGNLHGGKCEHKHPNQACRHALPFVREFIEDGFIKIVLAYTAADNKADIFTKNVVGDLYNKHTSDMVWKAKDMD